MPESSEGQLYRVANPVECSIMQRKDLKGEPPFYTWLFHDLKQAKRFFGTYCAPFNKQHSHLGTLFDHTVPNNKLQYDGYQAWFRALLNKEAVRSTVENGNALIDLLRWSGGGMKDVIPTRYTYIIPELGDELYFTDQSYFYLREKRVKHVMLANASTKIRYGGEFHPRPKGGWKSSFKESKDVSWELVFDNDSGTYTPSKDHLTCLKEWLEYNFPGVSFVVYAHDDEELKKSIKRMKKYRTERWEERIRQHSSQP